MIYFPNAKLNLGLNILSKRQDNYHNIETVFYPIPLCDALEIVPAKQGVTTFTQTGIPVDGDPDQNLVMKAYRLLAQDQAPLDIYLRKNIPFGAGLGGGSADAAFMLRLMNDYFALGLADEALEKLASRLGADCPFFIQNRPVFGEGIGDRFSSVDLSLAGYYLVLVKPDIHVSTKEAYSLVKPRVPERSIREIVGLPVGEWKDLLINDFESSVFIQYPAIARIKQQLYDAGALYASMSGSGSSVFGLFDSQPGLSSESFPSSLVYMLNL